MPRQRLRLGTRGSLLAVAQSRQVAERLRQHHRELQVELVTVETAGDLDQATPLKSVANPGFFSDELQSVLRAGTVDAVVHSRKDLPTGLPSDLPVTAMPLRANPRDVVVFRADVEERLKRGQTLRIGTSSNRREKFVLQFLAEHLPAFTKPPVLEAHSLRGPVDQRLHKLRDKDPAGLDGVVLALAGLERLWSDIDGRNAIADELKNRRWMVLPLEACPAAPGQGALALQTRREDTQTQSLVAPLHDANTARLVEEEYAAVASLAPERRNSAAATAIDMPNLDTLLFLRTADHHSIGQVAWPRPPTPVTALPWDSTEWMSQQQAEEIACDALPDGPVFVANARAAHASMPSLSNRRVWVSGLPSWRTLAERGVWVEGCADSLGFASIVPTLTVPVLGLPPLTDWLVLTRNGAEHSWRGSGVHRVLGTYRLRPREPDAAERAAVAAATHYYWSSVRQYDTFAKNTARGAHHACGPGKTAAGLMAKGLAPDVFPSREAWRQWLP